MKTINHFSFEDLGNTQPEMLGISHIGEAMQDRWSDACSSEGCFLCLPWLYLVSTLYPSLFHSLCQLEAMSASGILDRSELS